MLKDPFFYSRGPILVSLVFPAARSGDGSQLFAAIRPDSYDGAEDAPKVNRLVGYGKTKEKAIDDLIAAEAEYYSVDSDSLVTPNGHLAEIVCKIVNKTILEMDLFSDTRREWDRDGKGTRVKVAREVANVIQKVLEDAGFRLDHYQEQRVIYRE